MTRLSSWIVVAALALGCGQERDEAAPAQAPQPVAPVEVPAAPAEGAQAQEGDEVATLRARVAELEQQLAACQGAQPATPTAAIPEGVDVPEDVAEEASARPEARARDAGARTRRARDPSLIDTILGEENRPRRRRDETIELPNPASILLGE